MIILRFLLQMKLTATYKTLEGMEGHMQKNSSESELKQ